MKTVKAIFRQLLNWFLQGLLFFLPIGLSVYLVYICFVFVDRLLKSYIAEQLGVNIPGLGVVAVVALFIVLGAVGQTVIAAPFKALIEKIFTRTPILQSVYTSIKDFFQAFVGKEKKFTSPVLVVIDVTSKVEKLGFITQKDLSLLERKEKVAVYCPHAYNFSGELFIVPIENVTPLKLSASDVMKFAVTGGVTNLAEGEETDR